MNDQISQTCRKVLLVNPNFTKLLGSTFRSKNYQFLFQNRASKRLHQTVLIVEIGSQNFRAVPAIVKPDQNHPKAIKKPQTVPIPIEINCYNYVLAMLHNSNRIDPMAKKNQENVGLMCLELGFQGKYSNPNTLR